MIRFARGGCAVLAFSISIAATADQEKPYDYVETPWVEAETSLPAFPKEENLIEFYVGPAERNRFFVDGSSIAIGSDGVVRYVLVLKAAGGAKNVTLEGIRCNTREMKLFALGDSNGNWTKVQNPQWRLIENKLVNQYRAVLSRDFFCPPGAPRRDAAEVISALRRASGKTP